MTKADVLKLREAADALALQEQTMGIMNQPIEAEKRIQSAARYRLIGDMRQKAEEAYNKAFEQWYAKGMPE